MEYLIGISSHSVAILAISLILIFVMARALKNIQLSELFEGTGTGKISHTKFWSNVAYFVCTVAFAYMNFKPTPPEYLVELWFVYLTAVAGNASISKFLSLKYSQHIVEEPKQFKTGTSNNNMLEKG